MDDPPYIEDLDLTSVTTREELTALLQAVHLRADKPSLRALEAQTRHEATPLSKTSVSEMLKGIRFPRKAVMLAFLRACGVQDGQLEPWRRAWERIAARESGSARPDAAVRTAGEHVGASGEKPETAQLREQVKQLNADNERLRRELAAMGQRAMHGSGISEVAVARAVRSPTASRRELGIRLREFREEKGLTVDQVADHLMCSPGKINRMETSFRSGGLRDVRDLCDFYGVAEGAQRDHLMELAREARQPGWWEPYHLEFSTYVGLEADAVTIRRYQPAIVPGLLQTPDYARAMCEADIDIRTPKRVDELIEVRMTRQRLLTQADPPRLWSILDEAVLHRVVGGPQVMSAQLDRLIEAASLPNVTIQIAPNSIGAHPAMESTFGMLDFAGSLPSVVYVEGLVGWILQERPQDVERYQRVFEILCKIALNEEDSIALIANIARDLRGGGGSQ